MSEQNAQTDERHADYEEIEVAINDADSPSSHETITNALKELPGIRAIRASRGGVMISYNPVGVDQGQIRTAIERAGFTVDGIEGGRKSPQYPNPQPTKEPLDHLRPPPKTHDDPGGHKGQ